MFAVMRQKLQTFYRFEVSLENYRLINYYDNVKGTYVFMFMGKRAIIKKNTTNYYRFKNIIFLMT